MTHSRPWFHEMKRRFLLSSIQYLNNSMNNLINKDWFSIIILGVVSMFLTQTSYLNEFLVVVFCFLFSSLLTFFYELNLCSDTLCSILSLSFVVYLIFCGNLYWQLIFIIPYDYRVYRHLLLTRCLLPLPFTLYSPPPSKYICVCMHNDKHKLFFFNIFFSQNY